jgi:WD40 repeat protein
VLLQLWLRWRRGDERPRFLQLLQWLRGLRREERRLNRLVCKALRRGHLTQGEQYLVEELADNPGLLERAKDLLRLVQPPIRNLISEEGDRAGLMATCPTHALPVALWYFDALDAFGHEVDASRYEFGDRLGGGATGDVCQAWEVGASGLRRPRAAKFLLPRGDPDRFRIEARAQLSLSSAEAPHPHIVAIYGYGRLASCRGVANRPPFLVMELVEGGSLEDRLALSLAECARRGVQPFTPRGAAHLVQTLARALQYAHEKGVIHRDLKPGNVLLTHDGTPKLADFGHAACRDDAVKLTDTGQAMGTPAYMAPEQLGDSSDAADPRTDVYGLCGILYALLTGGAAPFDNKQWGSDLIRQIQQENPRPPGSHPSTRKMQASGGAGEARRLYDLETICLKGLRKRRGDRYPSAAALTKDLENWLNGRPIRARRPGWLGGAWDFCCRKPWQAVPLLLGLCLLAAGTVAATYYFIAARTEEARHNEEIAKHEANRLNVRLAFDSGMASLKEGEPVAAEFQWLEALRLAAGAEDAGYQRVIRLALSSIATDRHRLENVIPQEAGVDPTIRLALSPDGKYALRICDSARIDLVEIATGSVVWALKLQGASTDIVPGALAFRPPGGDLCAVATVGGRILVIETSTGKDHILVEKHPGRPMTLAFRPPDGRVLLVGASVSENKPGDMALAQYDLTTGTCVGPALKVLGNVFAAAYSPDGRTIAASGDKDKCLRLYDATTGQERIDPAPHPGPIFALLFSPDGKTVVTGCLDGGIRFFDAATGRPVGSPLRQTRPVRALAYHRDEFGELLLSGAEDGTARLWDPVSRTSLGQPLHHLGEVRSVGLTPDGRRMVTGGFDGTVRLWQVQGRSPLERTLRHPAAVACLNLSTDGRLLLTGSRDAESGPGEAWLWSVADGRLLRSFPQGGEVLAGLFRPGTSTVLTGGNDGYMRLWDQDTGEPRGEPLPHNNVVRTADVSADGHYAAFAGRGKIVRLYDFATKPTSWASPDVKSWVWNLAFSPDGRLLLTDGGPCARLWGVPSGMPKGVMPHASGAEVNGSTFSPDGTKVMTWCRDGTMRLWSVSDCALLHDIEAHQKQVNAGAFSPDGTRVATGGADGAVRLWDVATGRLCLPPLVHESEVLAVAFSSDGSLLATGCEDGMARLWDTATGAWTGAFLLHKGPVTRVIFASLPGGTGHLVVLTASNDGTARVWDIPDPVLGDPADLKLRLEVESGMELSRLGGDTERDRLGARFAPLAVLTAEKWQARRAATLRER